MNLAGKIAYLSSLLFAISPIWADVVFLTDGSVLGGKVVAENNKSLTLELTEIRTSAAVWNSKNFIFSKQKASWQTQNISKDLLYSSGSPLLPEAVIPLNLVKAKLVLPTAEIKTRQGVLSRDFYRKTEFSVYYYDLRQSDSSDLQEPQPRQSELRVKEDVGGGFTVPGEVRAGLQRLNLTDIISLEVLEPTGRRKIYPETRPWFSQFTAGVGYSLYYPVGAVAPLGLSPLGFTISTSADLGLSNLLPQLTLFNLRSRVGFLAGWQYLNYETTFSTTKIHLFPLLGRLTLYNDLPREISGFSFAPFVTWGNGVIVSRVSKEVKPAYKNALLDQPPLVSEVYAGYAFQLTGGMELYYRKHPAIAYGFETGYLFHAEQVSGHFIIFHLYATYRFTN